MRRWFSFPILTTHGTETLSRKASEVLIVSFVSLIELEFALAMEGLTEEARTQSSPGILIFDLNNKLLYSNQEALSLLKNERDAFSEVRRLCDAIKIHANRYRTSTASSGNSVLLWGQQGPPFSLRAYLIGARSNGRPATHLMVLVEKVAEQRSLSRELLQAEAKCLIGEAEAGRV